MKKGVSVSAMVTLSPNGAVVNADPMENLGICESDMATILLSEASSAKEGVELLLNIFDTVGAGEPSGVLIGDQNEIWYVENFTGHTYTAVKLSSDMITMNPNMGAIGLVDLDDTDNVLSSANLIEVAKQAGTYEGSETENTIDVYKSYCAYANGSPNARLVNGLNYFLASDTLSASTIAPRGLHHLQREERQGCFPVYEHSEQTGQDQHS